MSSGPEGTGNRHHRKISGEVAAAPALADYSRKWWILATVMVGTFMGPLDASVVNISLPALTRAFEVPITTVEWVALAYLLSLSTLLLTFGRLGDMIGLKPVYLAGFAVFVVGSLACGLAWSIWTLIGARVLQSLGAGMLFATGPAIVTQGFPPAERGKALGFVGVSVAAGLAVGPTLGGLVIGLSSWRWIFFINIPVGVAAFALASRVLRPEAPKDQKFDPMGAFLSLSALLPLLLALSKGEAWGWDSPPVLGLFVLSVLCGAGFLLTEMKVAQPVLELSLLRNRLFGTALGSAMASFMVSSTVLFLLPFYLLQVRGFDPQEAGLLLTPISATTALVGPLSGHLSDRIGSRILSTSGLAVAAAAVASMAWLTRDTGASGIALRLLAVGLGMGLFQSPNSSAIMGSVPRARLGIAAGMVATARNMGMVFGVSFAGMILAIREPVYLRELAAVLPVELAGKEAFLEAAHDVIWVATAICILGALLSLSRGTARPLAEVSPAAGTASGPEERRG